MTVTFPSSRTVRRAGWGVLLLALTCVAWFAATLETGVDTLAQDLQDVSGGYLGADLKRFERMTQAESIQYWIDLVSADIAAEPDSVDRLLEGVFLLSAIPTEEKVWRFGWGAWWSDTELRPLIIRWLDRACHLAPNDPRVWRARSRIDRRFSEKTEFPVTESEAIALLRQWQQAAIADSENALYDYIFKVNREWRGGPSFRQTDEMKNSSELASLTAWFESRQGDLDRLPFLDDGGSPLLFASRSLARLPLSATERHHFRGVLCDPGTALEVLHEQLNDAAPRQLVFATQLENRSPQTPWSHFWLKQQTALRDFADLNDAVSELQDRPPVMSASAAQGRFVHAVVEWNLAKQAATLAGKRLRLQLVDDHWMVPGQLELLERWHEFSDLGVPWFTRSTRARVIVLAGLLISLGIFGQWSMRRTAAATAPGVESQDSGRERTGWRNAALFALGLTAAGGYLVLFRSGYFYNKWDPDAWNFDLDDVIAGLPLVGAILLCCWAGFRVFPTVRVTRWQRVLTVTTICAVMSLSWGLVYWFHEAEFRYWLKPWLEAINVANVRLLEQDAQLNALGLANVFNSTNSADAWRFYFSQGLPLGLVLASLFWLGWVVSTTRPAGGCSFCDWFLARRPPSPSGELESPWRVRVVRDLSAGWLRYGLWGLSIWAVASACEMRSFDALYQREFHTHTTDADLWEDYQQVLSELRSDEQTLKELTKRVNENID